MAQQTNGALAKAKKIRDLYIANPNYCLYCNSPILPVENKSLSDTKKKKCCSRSCATKYSNRDKPKKIITCNSCGNLKDFRSKTGLCRKCYDYKIISDLENTTKGDLFSSKSNWQNARSVIQGHARTKFFLNTQNPECLICKYKVHIEIAHKKSVSSFSDDSTIRNINDLSNLIPLCPNHHWEYDNDLITI